MLRPSVYLLWLILYSLHYINYKGLKKLIKQCSTEGSESERSKATAFFFELDRSVEDIDAFNNKRAAEIRRRIGLLERRYNIGPSSDLNKLNLPSDEWEELVTAMLDLRSSLQKLLVPRSTYGTSRYWQITVVFRSEQAGYRQNTEKVGEEAAFGR